MKKEICVIHENDVIASVFEGRTSARLITKEREKSEMMSFHICKMDRPVMSSGVLYPKNDEIIYLVEGRGRMYWEDKRVDFTPGTAVYIPSGCGYRQEILEPSKIVVIIAPPRLRTEWTKRPDLVQLEPENALVKKV